MVRNEEPAPGHEALRAGRESVPHEWYAVTVCANGVGLVRVARVIIGVAQQLAVEGLITLHCVVILPDHCHLMFSLSGDKTLSEVMRLFKGRSSRLANRTLRRAGPLWQSAYYEHLIRDPGDAYSQWWYIVQNPVRRGLVEQWHDYPWTLAVPLHD